jgi:hypothetical protein
MFLLKGSTIGTSVIPTTSLATGKWSIMDAYVYLRLSSWPLIQTYPTSVNYLVVAGGGGSGGAQGGYGPGANGGSGIVIISYPTSYKAATSTTNATITTNGSNRVYIFTSTGSITF